MDSNCSGQTGERTVWSSRIGRAWGRVRWKIVAIITFTGTSTILMACLAIATLNVVVRRENANVVEKQIQVLVQASRPVAPAILDHAGVCGSLPANSSGLRALLAYTEEAFPQAQTYLTIEGPSGIRSLLPEPDAIVVKHPAWLPDAGFTGLVPDPGRLEIRNVLVRPNSACKATSHFSLPLASGLPPRLAPPGGLPPR